uniref:hypothetical protein n=1 Tax=unclassified Variovorax TaxID=663243 RepID=UPI000D47DD1D
MTPPLKPDAMDNLHRIRQAAAALRHALARRLRRPCIRLQCAVARAVRSRRGIFHAK